MKMSDFINSNYIKGGDLEPNVLIEAVIADVKRKEFQANGETETKAVVAFEDGRQVTLNQTRLKALIGAWGQNSDNWTGKTVIISRGLAPFKGDIVPSVKLDPVVAPRIGTTPERNASSLPPPPAQIIGSIDMRSGRDTCDEPPPSPPPPSFYDGPGDPDDEIPF